MQVYDLILQGMFFETISLILSSCEPIKWLQRFFGMLVQKSQCGHTNFNSIPCYFRWTWYGIMPQMCSAHYGHRNLSHSRLSLLEVPLRFRLWIFFCRAFRSWSWFWRFSSISSAQGIFSSGSTVLKLGLTLNSPTSFSQASMFSNFIASCYFNLPNSPSISFWETSLQSSISLSNCSMNEDIKFSMTLVTWHIIFFPMSFTLLIDDIFRSNIICIHCLNYQDQETLI